MIHLQNLTHALALLLVQGLAQDLVQEEMPVIIFLFILGIFMYIAMEMELILMVIFLFMEEIFLFSVKEIEIMNLLIMMEISHFLMEKFWVLVQEEWKKFIWVSKKEMKCMPFMIKISHKIKL